jgi:hypothetical protein
MPQPQPRVDQAEPEISASPEAARYVRELQVASILATVHAAEDRESADTKEAMADEEWCANRLLRYIAELECRV